MNRLPLLVPEDLRFTCHRCGVCCRQFTVTLDPGERARIERHDWRKEAPRFRQGFSKAGEDPWGRPRDKLLKHEGACIFLDEDGLCLVEKRLGREAKPRVCRKFPFIFVAAPDGERAAVSIECASRWKSLASGSPVAAARDELERLRLESEPLPVRWRVQVAKGERFLSPEEYLALEASLRAAVAEAPLERALSALGAAVVAARGARAAAEPVPVFESALGQALVATLEAAQAEHAPVADAARSLSRSALAFREALAAIEAAPERAAFLRALLDGWIWEAIPGRAATAEDGVGEMILGALLTAALGRELSPSGPALPALNLAARSVALFLRSRETKPLRAAPGRFAPLARAAARGV